GMADARRYLRVYEGGHDAIGTYSPGPYPGRVVLFRATEEPASAAADETLGWRELVEGELEVCRVPGHHWAMVYPPHLEVLAERLRRLLDEVRTDGGAQPGPGRTGLGKED
ncbi:MAG: hypothetical protein GY856_45015, partial [bacterium]|nr:hypothetical protein [bacterium]